MGILKQQPERIYCRTPDELREALLPWFPKAARPARLGFDIETTGLKPWLEKPLLGQLSDGQRTIIAHWKADLTQFRPFLVAQSIQKVIQNAAFECMWFEHHFDIRVGPVWDTKLADLVLRCGLPLFDRQNSLGDIVLRYTGKEIDKETGGALTFVAADPETFEPTDAQITYAAQDAEVVLPVQKIQQERITRFGLAPTMELENRLVPILARMMLSGMPVDVDAWRQLLTDLRERTQGIERFLIDNLTVPMARVHRQKYQAMLGPWQEWKSNYASYVEDLEDSLLVEDFDSKGKRRKTVQRYQREYRELHPEPKKPSQVDGPINLDSPQQLLDALRELGVETQSTDLKSLTELARTGGPETTIIEALMEWRSLHKLETGFGETVLVKVDTDGRIRPELNQVVSTGRMSCRTPNLQQIPNGRAGRASADLSKRFRSCFVAPAGRVFVVADYGSIEFRIAAELASEQHVLGVLESGGDPHVDAAVRILGIPADQVTKAQRDAAKTINYGVVYRLSAYGLAWRLGITKDEAQELLTRWNEEHPNMARMLRDLGQRAMTPELGNRGAVRTLNGRWRLFQLPRRGEEEYYKKKARIERAGANAPIQGTSADITKLALIYLDQAQSSHSVVFKILLAVHDEIVTECDQGDAEAVEQLLRSCMERAAQRWLKEVPIVVDTKITQTWQH